MVIVGRGSSGGEKYKFRLVAGNATGGIQQTLNGSPVNPGDEVDVEAGEICDFFGSIEYYDFVTDGGVAVPYYSKVEKSTRAGSVPLHNIFFMPKDNVTIS